MIYIAALICFMALFMALYALYLNYITNKSPEVFKQPYRNNPSRQARKFMAEQMNVTPKKLRKIKRLRNRIKEVHFENKMNIVINHENPRNRAPIVSVYDDQGQRIAYALGIRSKISFYLEFLVDKPISGVVLYQI